MPEVVAPIVSVVARRIHDRMYPGTSADCKLCPELAAIAVDAALTELSAAGRLLPEGATGEHVYLSTGCLHARAATDPDEAKRLHGYCQSMTGVLGEKRPATCKHCPAHCVCECHKSPMAVKEGE